MSFFSSVLEFFSSFFGGKEVYAATVKNKPNRLCLHWSAGTYSWHPPEKPYHFIIDGDGQTFQERSVYELGIHCWKSNTQNIGISMLCMAKGCPPKPIQIEKAACLVAECCYLFNIDIDGAVLVPEYKANNDRTQLNPTNKMVSVPTVADHAMYAKLFGYFPDRIDIGSYRSDDKNYYKQVLNKAKWYLNKLKSGERKIELLKKVY